MTNEVVALLLWTTLVVLMAWSLVFRLPNSGTGVTCRALCVGLAIVCLVAEVCLVGSLPSSLVNRTIFIVASFLFAAVCVVVQAIDYTRLDRPNDVPCVRLFALADHAVPRPPSQGDSLTLEELKGMLACDLAVTQARFNSEGQILP